MAYQAELEQRYKQIQEDRAKLTLQYSHDYFDYFHRNERWPGIEARSAIFKASPIPKWVVNRRTDPVVNISRPMGPQTRDRTGEEFWRYERTDNGAGRVVDPGMRQKLEALGIEIGAVLGAGSQGLAVAMRFKGTKLVVKYADDLQTMVVEMWAMRQMVGARHIVQRRWIPGLRDSGVGGLSEELMSDVIAGKADYSRTLPGLLKIDMRDRVQRNLVYTMEYMKYGNMNGVLRKISTIGARLKSKELWRVFYCLFRACVGLAYDGWAEGADPETGQYIPTQEEFVLLDDANQLLETREGLVDFDINERNVMLGTVPEEDMNRGPMKEHGHDEVPIFKIGDFGIVRAFRDKHRDSMLALASSRVLGNRWCNTPEQFSHLWNFYGADAAAINDLNADKVPGQYDWWTNLWQVGRLMTMMITQYQPQVPPECLRVHIIKPGGVTDTIYTYGSELLDEDLYGHYDLPLRSTVAWCLAHRPEDRPKMDIMEKILDDGIARNYPNEDQGERVTMAQLLSQPAASQLAAMPDFISVDM